MNTKSLSTRVIMLCVLLPALALAQMQGQSRAGLDKAIDENVGNHVRVQQMITALQQSVAHHDTAAVARLVAYPITINPKTKQAFTIRNQKTFIATYDKIITPAIASVIEKQRYEDLFVNYQGAMFGNGQVWIIGICRTGDCQQTDIKIRTIQHTQGTQNTAAR